MEIQTQKIDSEDYHVPVLTRRARAGLTVAGLVAAGSAFAATQEAGQPAPIVNPEENYTKLAHDSAQTPLQEGEKVLMKVKVNPNDSDRNSGSEAILNNKHVQKFENENPDEAAGIVASAENVPVSDEYALVERDINHDGEGDVVAVAVENDKDS